MRPRRFGKSHILDENLAMDRNKIHYIARMSNGAEVIGKALDDSQLLTIPQISERFGLRQMGEHKQDQIGLLSLLYYLGALTHTDVVVATESVYIHGDIAP